MVAAATAGVTGITIAWAVGTTPTPDASAGTAAQVSSQIAADKAAMSQLQQSIAATRGQLSALGGVDIPAGADPTGATGAPGSRRHRRGAGCPGDHGGIRCDSQR